MLYFINHHLIIFNSLSFLWIIQGVYNLNYMSANANDLSNGNFWGSTSIKALKLTCDDEIFQIICLDKCGANYDCIEGTCYCSNQKQNHIKIVEGSWDDIEKLFEANAHNNIMESYDTTDLSHSPRSTSSEENLSQEEQLTEHPALRHHIAHFCPNLDYARKCIRTCMKVGKPAFCGKDHVCYCGHRYTSHDEAKPLDVDDTYAKFRDLYEKYFGPQGKTNEQEI